MIDRGKDVAEEKIVEEALKNQVQLIGLSALSLIHILQHPLARGENRIPLPSAPQRRRSRMSLLQ